MGITFSDLESKEITFLYIGEPTEILLGNNTFFIESGQHTFLTTVNPLYFFSKENNNNLSLRMLEFIKSNQLPYHFQSVYPEKLTMDFLNPHEIMGNKTAVRQGVLKEIHSYQKNIVAKLNEYDDVHENYYVSYIEQIAQKQQRVKNSLRNVLEFSTDEITAQSMRRFMYSQIEHLNHRETMEFNYFEKEIKNLVGHKELFSNAMFNIKSHYRRLQESIDEFAELYEKKYRATMYEDKVLESSSSYQIEDFLSRFRAYP